MSRGEVLPGDQLATAVHSLGERIQALPVALAALAIGFVPGGSIPAPRAEASAIAAFDYDDTDRGPQPDRPQPWTPKPNDQYRHHGGNKVLKIGR